LDWVFQNNPDRYDLPLALKTRRDDAWSANQHRDSMSPGDRVFFWRSGPKAAIIAVGTITSRAYDRPESEFGPHAVDVRYDSVVEPSLAREEISRDDQLRSVAVFTRAQGTNFALTTEQTQSLVNLLEGRLKPLNAAAWNLDPGAEIERKALHLRFGGSTQGGITPSNSTPNILLFADPDVGPSHGYVDGWKADGRFDYTGSGQRGDQEMAGVNRSVLMHATDGRTLRLFFGSSGTVKYVGAFELDSEVVSFCGETRQRNIASMLIISCSPR